MICTIDIGNTAKKYAIWQEKQIVESGIWLEEPSQSMLQCHTWVVSNVTANKIVAPKSINLFTVSHQSKVSFTNSYATPSTLGMDRLASIEGAVSEGHSNAIILDLGTCIKTEVVINNEFIGGSIAPGFAMRLEAMHNFTGKLPLISTQTYLHAYGNNTQNCMLSGAITGALLEIEGRIDSLFAQFGTLPIIATGGHLFLLENQIKHKIFAQPFLIHQGLINLYLINV